MELGYCFLGFTLLFSSIYMMFLKDETKFYKFMNTLNDKQKNIYKRVINERLRIYLTGMVLGLCLAFLYQYYSKSKNVCIFLVIIFATKLIFYRAYPKSTYMLYHLDRKDQVDAWTDIYVYMKTNWMKSLGLGALSYLFLNYGFKI